MTAFKVETNGFVWTKTSTGFTALGFRDQSELSPHFTSLVSANQVSKSESVKIVKKESFVALSCNCCQCTVSIGQWIYILNPKDNFRTNKWHTGQGMFDCSKSGWAQCITGPVGHLHLHCTGAGWEHDTLLTHRPCVASTYIRRLTPLQQWLTGQTCAIA